MFKSIWSFRYSEETCVSNNALHPRGVVVLNKTYLWSISGIQYVQCNYFCSISHWRRIFHLQHALKEVHSNVCLFFLCTHNISKQAAGWEEEKITWIFLNKLGVVLQLTRELLFVLVLLVKLEIIT